MGKMGRFSIFAGSPYPKVQFKCASYELVGKTFAFFPDELFATDQFYPFEIRFFITCLFFCDFEVLNKLLMCIQV